MEVAGSIGKKLASDSVVAEINGSLTDMSAPITADSEFRVHTFSTEEGKKVFRHSAAHLLAQAVLRLYPESKLAIGPATESGFYYDIAHEPFKPEDLERIEDEMRKIAKEDHEVARLEMTEEEAKEKWKGNKYKLEIIGEEAKGSPITAYRQGEFTDLCRGPHAPRTGMLAAVRLTKLSLRVLERRPEKRRAPAHIRRRFSRQKTSQEAP